MHVWEILSQLQYEKLNQMKPENAIYMLNYAICLFELDNLEKSHEVLKEAGKLFEIQKNDLDKETIMIFEKNADFLRDVLENKKK